MKYAKSTFQHYIKYGLEASGHSLDWDGKEEIAAAIEDIVKTAVLQVEEKYEARITALEERLMELNGVVENIYFRQ